MSSMTIVSNTRSRCSSKSLTSLNKIMLLKRTIQKMARCMLGNLPSLFWDVSINTMIYTLNRCPTKAVEGKITYESCTRKTPNIAHLRVFGCDAYAFIIT